MLHRRDTAWDEGDGKFEDGKRGCSGEGLLPKKGRERQGKARPEEKGQRWLRGILGMGSTKTHLVLETETDDGP